MTARGKCDPLLVRHDPEGMCVFCRSCGYSAIIRLPVSASELVRLAVAHESAHRAHAAFALLRVTS